jgi:hypothetical protein
MHYKEGVTKVWEFPNKNYGKSIECFNAIFLVLGAVFIPVAFIDGLACTMYKIVCHYHFYFC